MALEIDNKVFENQMQVLQAAATMDGELGKRLRVTGTSSNTRLRITVPSASRPETVIFSRQDVDIYGKVNAW